MKGETFYTDHWISCACAAVIGFIFVAIMATTLSSSPSMELERFRYDFFTALSGHEATLRAENKKALKAASLLRSIPRDNLAEEWTELTLLAMADGNERTVAARQIVLADRAKADRVFGYLELIRNNRVWNVFFQDSSWRAVMFAVLNGEDVSPAVFMEKEFPSYGTYLLWIFLAFQFSWFAIYALVAAYGSHYHPLFEIPGGAGPKLSLLLVLPGALPLMLCLALVKVPSGCALFRSRLALPQRAKKKISFAERIRVPRSNSREAVAQLEARLGRKG